jgi:hypothetical protein
LFVTAKLAIRLKTGSAEAEKATELASVAVRAVMRESLIERRDIEIPECYNKFGGRFRRSLLQANVTSVKK